MALLVASCGLLPPAGCPAALLEGRLVADGAGGAAVENEFGPQPVRWPDGFTVDAADEIVLRNPLGFAVATEGEMIYVGGGMDPRNEFFVACGHVSRDPPG